MFNVADEFGLAFYVFFMSNAMALSIFLQLPKFDEMFSYEYRDLPELVKLLGCVSIQGKDLMDLIEISSSRALKDGESVKLSVYSIGPLVRTKFGIQENDDSQCLNWLDNHPNGCVLYISLGSCGNLSYE